MEEKSTPLVSVIIPTYKRSNMIDRTINSILMQTYDNIEVIVVDDNNPDSYYRKQTENTMDKYKENSRIKYIKHEKNKNGAAARNTGMKNSNGKYLCFLDDDDIYYPTKIEKQVDFLEKNKEYGAVYCGRRIGENSHEPKEEGDLSFGLLSGTCLVITLTIMVNARNAFDCGGWDESFKRNQEAAFLLRFFNKGYKIGYIDEVLCETDKSDRSNALKGKKNEEQILYYLNTFDYIIQNCEKKKKNARKLIYSYRYVGIFLDYAKSKDLKNMVRVFFTVVKKYPVTYNYILIRHIIWKIYKNPMYGFYKKKFKNDL